jgi:multimeric flavodoxin WrbA
MKITILNANPNRSGFDDYLEQVQQMLEQKGNPVSKLMLRELDLKYCIGCWDCWTKTPGICQANDASLKMDEAIINSDFLLWAAPLKMGYPSELLKKAVDKHIPLIHPYMEVVQSEAHHRKRYNRYPRVGLLVEKEASTDETDLRIVTQLFQRTALNLKSRLQFSLTSDTPAAEVVTEIIKPHARPLPMPSTPLPTVGKAVQPATHMTLFNGSPRGPHGNSPIFLEQLAQGFEGESKMVHLVSVKSTEEHVKAFSEAEIAWIAFPLYADAMPGIVKHFFEVLEPLVGRPNNPPVGFIVQSGFPEGLHSRFIERYLEKLAARLGSPYLGTIVKGNGEGVRMMPEEMNRKLFENLNALGKNLSKGERLDPAILAKIAAPERYPAILTPVFQVFLKLPIAHGYFDGMLKENGVYAQRFDQPFLKTQI